MGYGLEGVITDSIAGKIIRQKLTPYFKEGKFGDGLITACATIAHLVAKEYNVSLSLTENRNVVLIENYNRRRKGPASLLSNLLLFLFIFTMLGARIFFFPLLFGGGGYWRGGGGGFGGFGGFGGGGSGGGGASGGW